MPNYDYVCENCSREWIRMQSINSKPDPTCPYCRDKTANRQIGTGAGFIFKGNGFYVNDYKKVKNWYKKGIECEGELKRSHKELINKVDNCK